MNKFGINIIAHNGEGRFGLPVPGTFVIDSNGVNIAQFAKVDFSQRMEPKMILNALKEARHRFL